MTHTCTHTIRIPVTTRLHDILNTKFCYTSQH